jgi:hypothetical protein
LQAPVTLRWLWLCLDVRMKTFVCLECGKMLESSECIHPKGRWSIHQHCPACGARVCVSGGALVVIGLLWLLFWGMSLCGVEEAFPGIVVGTCFTVLGVMRLIQQYLAEQRTKCRPDDAAKGNQPLRSETNSTSGAAGSGR